MYFWADIVFTMLGFPADVRAVMLGQDGVLANMRPGGIVIDMTTSEVFHPLYPEVFVLTQTT